MDTSYIQSARRELAEIFTSIAFLVVLYKWLRTRWQITNPHRVIRIHTTTVLRTNATEVKFDGNFRRADYTYLRVYSYSCSYSYPYVHDNSSKRVQCPSNSDSRPRFATAVREICARIIYRARARVTIEKTIAISASMRRAGQPYKK